MEADHAGRLSVGLLNTQLVGAGASVSEYGAAMKYAVAQGYLSHELPRKFSPDPRSLRPR
jgi:hypothetical protein